MKKLINPIANFDEKVLLGVGLFFLGISICLSPVLGFKMSSIMHVGLTEVTFNNAAFSISKSVTLGVIIYYAAALIINKRTRFIDILNSVLIALVPLFLVSTLMSIPWTQHTFSNLSKNDSVSIFGMFFLFFISLTILPLLAYYFVLLFNGFKTATNLKEWYHVALFVVVSAGIAAFTPYIF